MQSVPYKVYLTEEELPKSWLNIKAFMKDKPAPLLNPATNQACTVSDLSPVFCTELAEQELNCTDKFIKIPKPVNDFYKLYRPSPLVRAYSLEKYLDTPAEIYYKFEGNNTSGSHKLNSAAAQIYYAKKQNLTRVTTETGAGQWGTALSMAGAYFGVEVKVYMVKVSFEQKPFRKNVMNVYGADVIASPSPTTRAGRAILAAHPDTNSSLGCAISEAVEAATSDVSGKTRYVLGSVLDQVLLHQSIIGQETKTALDKIGRKADIIIGCAGGGSNLGGLIAPFVAEKLQGVSDAEIIAVEPASCPSLTQGEYRYDYCDTGKITPLAKMYTLGCDFIPSPNHAGGLRYHGMSPIISKLYDDKLIRAISYAQSEVFDAAVTFARIEGTLPAPESAHAIKGAMDAALKCKMKGEKKVIVFGLTGTGYFDMKAYDEFLSGKMKTE